jgi:hypothetical protein
MAATVPAATALPPRRIMNLSAANDMTRLLSRTGTRRSTIAPAGVHGQHSSVFAVQDRTGSTVGVTRSGPNHPATASSAAAYQAAMTATLRPAEPDRRTL